MKLITESRWSGIKKKLIFISIFLLISIFLFVFLPNQIVQMVQIGPQIDNHELEKAKQDFLVVKIFEEALPNLEQRWLLGDLEDNFINGRFSCNEEIGDYKYIHPNYLRCNPNYLQCFFENKTGVNSEFEVVYEKKKYHVYAKDVFKSPERYNKSSRYYSINRINGENLVKVELGIREFPQSSFNVYLKNQCNQTYLPQRKYLYGTNDYWNNFNSNIFIDTHLVTFRDLADWIDYASGDDSIKIPQNSTDLASFAYNLTPNQMKNYCNYQKKQLLKTHIFDAGSFYPQDIENNNPSEINNFPYPFSVKTQDVYLYKVQKDLSLNLNIENCQNIYVQDCLKIIPYQNFFPYSTSWIGLFEVMGGPFEYLDNPVEKKLNVKASSFYFNRLSPFHYLGVRLKWDESNFNVYNFEHLVDVDGQTKYRVGFRCFENIGNENVEKP